MQDTTYQCASSLQFDCCLFTPTAVLRIAALEGELTHIRELVVLLGKAMGRLPGGQQLPGHDDPVWQQLGPLGGVSFALDTVIQHTRVRQGVH